MWEFLGCVFSRLPLAASSCVRSTGELSSDQVVTVANNLLAVGFAVCAIAWCVVLFVVTRREVKRGNR